jgi:hypothetical protein
VNLTARRDSLVASESVQTAGAGAGGLSLKSLEAQPKCVTAEVPRETTVGGSPSGEWTPQ